MSDGREHPGERLSARETPAVIHLPHLPPPTLPSSKKRPKRQRGHVEQFRTDADEHAALVELARKAGLSLGAYYRRELLGDAGPRAKRAPPTEASWLNAAHIAAINRAGSLLNQGIRAVNEIARAAPTTSERDRLSDELESVRGLLESAVPALKSAFAAALAGDVRES